MTAGAVVGSLTPAVFHDPVELEARRRTIVGQVGTVRDNPFDVIVALVNFGRWPSRSGPISMAVDAGFLCASS